jgi:hypothetical protein
MSWSVRDLDPAEFAKPWRYDSVLLNLTMGLLVALLSPGLL